MPSIGYAARVQTWMPVPGSAKGALALLALEEFGARGYEDVNVVDLAARAGVTTGSLYHHFGNKLGLYTFVRTEVERRLLDRMEGAAEATGGTGPAAAAAALLVGFDAAVRQQTGRLVAEAHPAGGGDPLHAFLATLVPRIHARLLLAAWRAALDEVAAGTPPAAVRATLSDIVA